MNNHKKIIVFVGPPGPGKGTLAVQCVHKLGWLQLSTGNLCRKHIAEQTDIGKAIDFALKSGKLVSDDLIVKMAHDWLALSLESHKVIVFDGYPRTLAQARSLMSFVEHANYKVDLIVIQFEIADEKILERLNSRYVCSNKECQAVYSLASGGDLAPKVPFICDLCQAPLIKREDDEPLTVRERLEKYRMHEQEMLSFWQDHCEVIKLASEKPLDEVFESFSKTVGLTVV